MKLRTWGAFWLLGLIWGSSFLWIKIAVQELPPVTLVAMRLFLAVIGLGLLVHYQRQRLPRQRGLLLAYLYMGIFNTALPFSLVSWGETSIDSGLTSILSASVPLFTMVIAHLWLHDEKMTLSRVAGLVVGFLGVVTLVSRSLGSGGAPDNMWGELAIVGGAICYATSANFARKYLRGQPAVVQAAMTMLVADAGAWLGALWVDRPVHLPALPATWLAVIWLGVLGSGVAYLLFFYLINSWGATRTTMVSYVFPVIGLILGVTFLRERADWSLAAGSLLVLGGIVIVNLKGRPQSVPAAVSAD
jgi:drug/metabolite transporter (DMT)-like permease